MTRYVGTRFAAVLREGGRANTSGRERHRVRNLLVAGQLALGLVLLVGSGLMLRSFAELRAIDLGIEAEGVLTMGLHRNRGEDAGLSARFEFPGKRALGALVLVPLILPPFVGAIGLSQILGRSGALNTLLIELGLIEQGLDFIGRGGIISGFRGDGVAISEQIAGILLPVDSDCTITAPAATRAPFRGRPPEGGLDATLLSNLQREDAREVTVFPILIRDQVVNLLYTDNGQNPLGETGFAALGARATLISRAYERLILERKSALE